jgi:hypothetical protein
MKILTQYDILSISLNRPDIKTRKAIMIMRKASKSLVFILMLVMLFAQAAVAENLQQKNLIGETAKIKVEETGEAYLARIDTGARITSIHAMDLEVEGGSNDKQDNVGKMVTFTTINEHDKEVRITTKIEEVAKVRNAQGVEYRYVVELTLIWQGIRKKSLVNLRDRSAMTYKLLIGRNWLSSDFIVDVDISEGVIK